MEEREDIRTSPDELETVNRSLIELHLCKGNILVWNANDVKLLRETHHIVGALVGSLPRAPRQNAQLGLPLQLTPEEAAVLFEYDVARMVNVKMKTPSADDVAAFEEMRHRSFTEQQALWDDINAKKKQDFDSVIALGRTTKKHRRAERAKRKKIERASAPGRPGEDERTRCCTPEGVRRDTDGEKGEMQGDAVGVETVADNDAPSTTGSVSCEQPEDSSADRGEENSSRTQTSSSCMESCGSPRNDSGKTSTNGADTNNQPDTKGVTSHPLKGGPRELTTSTDPAASSQRSVTETERLSLASRRPPGVVPDTDPDTVRDSGDTTPPPNTNSERQPGDVGVFKKPCDPRPCTGYLVHVVTASPATPKLAVTEWAYPTTEQETLRYRVFRDLWETGYYLTSGCKFGGDFLVYPGDPFLFHSYFIAICVPHGKSLSPLELITYGRLGTNVRKTVILCSVDEDNELAYTSLQWTGLS